MVHVLLPFMVLPLYSVMKGIDPRLLARGCPVLGRARMETLPGHLPADDHAWRRRRAHSWSLMLSVGYYITPALVGGADDQMISYFIAFYASKTVNWGMAAALASLLLVMTGLLVAVARLIVPGVGVAAVKL